MDVLFRFNAPALSAFSRIEHYEAVKKEDPEVSDFSRLCLIPGMLHCGGGPGPGETDWISLIRRWVEKGEAPKRVLISKIQYGELIMTRPVFSYPGKAVDKVSGNPDDANNFERHKK